MSQVLGLSLVGFATSLFLGIQFFRKGNRRLVSNTFLGFFFIIIAIRIGKLPIQASDLDLLQNVYFNLMHASYLALGPILWLYIRSYGKTSSSFSRPTYYHFLPALFFLISAYQLRLFMGEPTWLVIYWIVQAYPLTYIVLVINQIRKSHYRLVLSSLELRWFYSLTLFVCLIIGMNALYFVSGFPFYLVTSSLLLFTAYIIIFLAFQNRLKLILGGQGQKYKNIRLAPAQQQELWEAINSALIERELYLDPQLKLKQLSDELDESAHKISMVINQESGMGFPDYVNRLRIQSAKIRILESQDKVIGIAIDSGFASLSAFNKAFKKHTGKTPSGFRKSRG